MPAPVRTTTLISDRVYNTIVGDLRGLFERLSGEREFFNNYRDRFVENFLTCLEEEVPGVLNSQTLRVLVRRVYSLIFSFREGSEEEMRDLFYSLATHGVDIKRPLTKSMLRLVRDYIDHITDENGDYRKVKDLLELTDLVLLSLETAYSRYLRELRQKAGEKEGAEVSESVEGVLELLRRLRDAGEEVEIIAYYKEVPAMCRTKVVEVGEGGIEVERCDLNILREGSEVYLRLRNLPGAVGVRVEEVDPRSERAKLKLLGLVDLPQERRRFVRVVPEDPVPVVVMRNGWETTGSMADVSVGGVGVYLKDADDLKTGDVVRVRFRLPKGEVDTLGSVRYVLRRGDVFRIGVQYELDLKQEDVVSDYVMERQFQILKELRGL
jgi:hypothetical protein